MAKKPIPVNSGKPAKTEARPKAVLKTLIENRKARHNYSIVTAYECGIVLQGTEVKSCRMAHINLTDAYARILNNEVILLNAHISPYDKESHYNHEPTQARKLLLHKTEIRKISGMLKEKGFTLIPLKMYLKNGHIKVELGVCKGKNAPDKRDTLKARAQDMDTKRAVARYK